MDKLPTIDAVCRNLNRWENDLEKLTQIVKKAREIDTKMKTHNPDDSEYLNETAEEAYQRAVHGTIAEDWIFTPREPDQTVINCLLHSIYWYDFRGIKDLDLDKCKGSYRLRGYDKLYLCDLCIDHRSDYYADISDYLGRFG